MNIQKITLLGTFFLCPIYCIDPDIFKETLTLSSPVEAQEQQESVQDLSFDCFIQIRNLCKREFAAFNFDLNNSPTKAEELQKCFWQNKCVQKFKKPVHLS
jgi:5-bromo-4-chloroindolyl phosphate hydrolysis protein